MFNIKYLLLLLIIISKIVCLPHINLYYTELVNENIINRLSYNCLRVSGSVNQSNMYRNIISYCMNEFLPKFSFEKNVLYKKMTFDELSKENITSEQLYYWSASIDLIENYQFYLNELSIGNNSSLSKKLFYNCTLPRFGYQCEYKFDYYHLNHISLYHIIRDFYNTYKYNTNELTCYKHLICNRGHSLICLDWSEICDGKIDCIDNGFDEQYCLQMEINQCNKNEFRCHNGQCIPILFYHDDNIYPDCLDQSDIIIEKDQNDYLIINEKEPTFGYEDIICIWIPLSSSCIQNRHNLIYKMIFFIKNNQVSDKCWSAFKCVISIENKFNRVCKESCEIHINIVNKECSNMIFIPSMEPLYSDIDFDYAKSNVYNLRCWTKHFPYKCSDNGRYYDLFIGNLKLVFNNIICYYFNNRSILFESHFTRDMTIIYFEHSNNKINSNKYTFEICNTSNMYQCINSSKCISIYRIFNGINDCPYEDDENINKMNYTHGMKQAEQYYFKCPESNKFFPQNTVRNYTCYCGFFNPNTCMGNMHISYGKIKENILFETICNGFVDINSQLIDEQNEIECEEWSCNNIYTRCDNIWDCSNGADEAGCYISLRLNCSSNDHICVSIHTNQFICLSLTKINDGIVDCYGAFDESNVCRRIVRNGVKTDFFCASNHLNCSSYVDACDGIVNCPDGSDERLCNIDSSLLTNDIVIFSSDLSHRISPMEFISKTIRRYPKEKKYFSLDQTEQSIVNEIESIEYTKFIHYSLIKRLEEFNLYCHRGLHLRFLLNNSIVCLCPPSYYGNRCQYQNERISLTIQFKVSSHSSETLFSIIILLIDNDNYTRIIHSYEQFSYLSIRDCGIKFNIYLIYSTKPKDLNKTYSIHIDIYEKISLSYRSSLLIPIEFPFLPVHRLSFIIDIPGNNNTLEDYSNNNKCINGKSIKYLNNPEKESFCQCYRGWIGKYCNIKHTCICSLDSICIGIDAYNRSVCICPIHRFGSRCLIINRICINNNILCKNGGQCIPNDEYIESDKKFTCICPKGYMGKECEIIENEIIISFEENIILSELIYIHFIKIIKNGEPERATTFQKIFSKKSSINISWSQRFHLVFIEIITIKKNYYLSIILNNSIQSKIINKTIHLSDRCHNINELFNNSFIKLNLIHRIKYYHLPCQNEKLNLSCFYDDIHLCLCQQHLKQRIANCFRFDHNQRFDCSGQSECENNGTCFQDSPICPKRSICRCSACYYGSKCLFRTSGFGLTLDSILGYHISPLINFNQQSLIIKLTLTLTIIFIIGGILNSIFSIMTFKNKNTRKVGCGWYLLGTSITSLLTIIIFGFKFLLFILSQLNIIENKLFLSIQCHSIDFLLRIFLSMDQWLNACIALERTITVIKGTNFNKKKSEKLAKYVINSLILFTIGSSIHEPIYRRLVDEENNDEKRIWCIVSYPKNVQIYDSIIYPFHVLVPFMINIISAFILIRQRSNQQSNIQINRNFKEILFENLKEHKFILIAPIVLIILALPRIIIAFAIECMKSIDQSWIFLFGYFLSFIPVTLTFLVFVLPSKFYIQEFHKTVKQFRNVIQRRFQND